MDRRERRGREKDAYKGERRKDERIGGLKKGSKEEGESEREEGEGEREGECERECERESVKGRV